MHARRKSDSLALVRHASGTSDVIAGELRHAGIWRRAVTEITSDKAVVVQRSTLE